MRCSSHDSADESGCSALVLGCMCLSRFKDVRIVLDALVSTVVGAGLSKAEGCTKVFDHARSAAGVHCE